MTNKEVLDHIEKVIKNEEKEIALHMKKRGLKTFEDNSWESVEPQTNEENALWDDGYIEGMRSIFYLLASKLDERI